MQDFIDINEDKMLEEIRTLLQLTIEDFVFQMEWPNSKYYDYIKNGRKINNVKKKSHPSISKVFTGINIAILKNDNWKDKEKEIKLIVMKYLFPI